MAIGNIKGITIQFNGDTTRLDKALREINNSTRDLDKELKQVNSALKFNPTSVELWAQKQEILKQKVSETEKKLDALKQAQKQMDDSNLDNTSAEYRELQREIITTEDKLKTFKRQLAEVGNAKLSALQQSFEQVGKKAESAGRSLTTHVTAPIVAAYTASAKYASDYEENLNKIDVAFGKNSESVKDWANNARSAFGMSKVQATEAVSGFGALGKGIGLTEKQAAEMSITLSGLSADLGSYFNASTADSAKALEGIFTGESEALKKFGVVMNDTNLEKFAADQGLVWKEMDQSQKVTLRYNYVLAKTKDAQGDFSRTSSGTANSTKMFTAATQDLSTAIGENLLPLITPIIQKLTQLIDRFNKLSPQTQKIITYVGLALAVLGPLLIIIGKVALGISSVIKVVKLASGAIGLLSSGSLLPIIAVIGAVIAAGVLLYKNWDKIKAGAKLLWGYLKTAWDGIKTKTVNAWNAVKNAIITPFKTARDKIKYYIDKIKGWFPIKLGKIFKGIKMPHFEIEWSSVKAFGKEVKYPSGFDISWYKNGGIFDNPSLIGVGEAGPEAVVPLDKFWDKLDSMNTGVTINVYASDGMNVNELALKIEQRLVLLQKQRQMAHGSI